MDCWRVALAVCGVTDVCGGSQLTDKWPAGDKCGMVLCGWLLSISWVYWDFC